MSQPSEQSSKAPEGAYKSALAYAGITVLAVAAAAATVSFNAASERARDRDPAFVTPTAQQRIEDMGFSNVRFHDFNKAANKPAQLTFTAEKDAVTYSGEAHCTATACPRITVKQAKLGG